MCISIAEAGNKGYIVRGTKAAVSCITWTTQAAETGTLLYRCFFKKKYREMLWVISVIYPTFFALIFNDCFLSKKMYFFQNVATHWAPPHYCVLWYVNKEGYTTMCRAKCWLIRLFLQRIAMPRNTRICC